MNQMDAPDLVLQHLDKGVLTVTLGAAPAHPLSLGMIRALHKALVEAGGNPEVRAIVIHGEGRIFCAGHDLKEIARHRQDTDDGLAYLQELFEACAEMMQIVTLGPKPTIAMVEGLATAGGLQLVAACDLAFAADNATFCLPGVANGGFCTTPAVAVGRAIPRKLVLEMAMSGAVYDAPWARDAGLVSRVLPGAELAAFVRDFAQTLATHHPKALSDGKQAFHRQIEMPLGDAYAEATRVMIGHFMDPVRIAREKETWGQKLR